MQININCEHKNQKRMPTYFLQNERKPRGLHFFRFVHFTNLFFPIYIMINELPISVRCSELIVVGLWFGKNKPNMNIFLKPFVDNMNKLSEDGIKCKINNEERIIHVYCLVCCVDSVALAPIKGLTQFNVKYGCNWCLHPGQWIVNESNPNSGSHKYPLLESAVKLRNESDNLKHMTKATEKNTCFGFKNPSELIN